jgi:glycosyltransferase involved in cell wall biosynthesis
MFRLAMNPLHSLSGGGANFFSRLSLEIAEKGYAKLVSPYNSRQDMGLYSSVSRGLPWHPFVLRIDGIYFDQRETYGSNRKLNKKIFKSIDRAAGIIFQSAFSRQLVESHYGELPCPATVILNGAPLQNMNRVASGKSKAIVCSANWRPNKRLNAIVNAVRELRKQIDCELYVLGKTPGNTVASDSFVHYIGEVSPSDVDNYLGQADLFIHLAWLDPCPNSVVEALVHGVPVLCSNRGGTPELVRATGLGVVVDCDPEVNLGDLVDYHKPPQPDLALIVSKAAEMLDSPSDSFYELSSLDIGNVAKDYVTFCKQVAGSSY